MAYMGKSIQEWTKKNFRKTAFKNFEVIWSAKIIWMYSLKIFRKCRKKITPNGDLNKEYNTLDYRYTYCGLYFILQCIDNHNGGNGWPTKGLISSWEYCLGCRTLQMVSKHIRNMGPLSQVHSIKNLRHVMNRFVREW